MSEIVEQNRDGSAFTKEYGFIENQSNIPNKKTKGWEVPIEWKDDTKTQVDIKYIKEERLIELVDYAVTNQISDETAFDWWVPYTLKKSNRIISTVKTKYWRTTYKYGARLPKNIT